MLRKMIWAIISGLLIMALYACKNSEESKIEVKNPGASRNFYMGFTTWKYAASIAAQNDVYNRIKRKTYGDIVGLHYMEGVPWDVGKTELKDPATLKATYSATKNNATDDISVTTFIDEKIQGTAPVKVIYLAIDPINDKRDDIGKNYVDGGSTPSDFARPAAKFAYSNFVFFALYEIYSYYTAQGVSLPMVYVNYGSEASDLILKKSNIDASGDVTGYTTWDQFVDFSTQIATNIRTFNHSNAGFKRFVRDARLMVSAALKSPKDSTSGNLTKNSGGGWTFDDRMEVLGLKFPEILSYVDVVGVSTYGYIYYDGQYTVPEASHDLKRADPDTLPTNWLSQIKDISGSKKIAVTETSWIAQNYDVFMDGNYIINSDATRQNAYTEKLLAASDALGMEFVIWFSLVDYDPLWDLFGTARLFGLTWRNTGFFDISADTHAEYLAEGAKLTARTAWSTWTTWLDKTKN